MKAVYYCIQGRALTYIHPESGKPETIEAGEQSINTVVADFHRRYGGATSISVEKWLKRVEAIEWERVRLRHWNEGTQMKRIGL